MVSSTVAQLGALAPTISIGILTANVMTLGEDLTALDDTGVGILHFDVMDGCFCPAMTFGPAFIKAIKTSFLKDVHLMISEPLGKISEYAASGADILTVHLESEPKHIHRVCQAIGKMINTNDPARGIVRGIAINPGTSIDLIKPLLDEVDMVTLLAVNPGWGGQQFISSTRDRLAQLRRIIGDRGTLICVDGGITRDNINEVASMNADLVITGSAVFDGKDPKENAKFMLGALRSGR